MKKNILFAILSILILSSCARSVFVPPVLQNTSPTDESDFSIIILPDTQNEVQNFPKVFMNQINWIIAHKERINIQSVVHVGDQVNIANDEKQWKTFDAGIKKLDAINMPTLLAL